ncbi:hypothetical protein ACRRTK_008908 [Alexandromys fortis]
MVSALATPIPGLLWVSIFFHIFSEHLCPAGVKTRLTQLRTDVAPPLPPATHLAEVHLHLDLTGRFL